MASAGELDSLARVAVAAVADHMNSGFRSNLVEHHTENLGLAVFDCRRGSVSPVGHTFLCSVDIPEEDRMEEAHKK